MNNPDFYLSHRETGVSLAEIQQTDPDLIDCVEFWKRITDNDYTPFCPIAKKQEDVNFYNSQLLMMSGFYQAVCVVGVTDISILDLGSGFNCVDYTLKHNFPVLTYKYYPCDIIKYTEETLLIENSVLPIHDRSIDLAVSTNVFQHLGVEQITKYSKELFRVLQPGGVCFIGMLSQSGDTSGTLFCKELGLHYTILDNQAIPLYKWEVIARELCELGMEMILYTIRGDGYVGFLLRKINNEST